MRKAAAGLVAGILFAVSATAYAEDIGSVIGRAVEGALPLVIDGKHLDKEVIVIDGTSYLPVRAAGEMFGYKVDFVRNEVVLNKQEAGGRPADSVYGFKTSLFTLSSAKGKLIARDGEQYASVLVFEKYLSNNGTDAVVALPGRTPVEIPLNAEYTPGAAGYYDNGLFVRLSALELKAEINGTSAILVHN